MYKCYLYCLGWPLCCCWLQTTHVLLFANHQGSNAWLSQPKVKWGQQAMNQMSNVNIKGLCKKKTRNKTRGIVSTDLFLDRKTLTKQWGDSEGVHANENYRGVTVWSSAPFCTHLCDYNPGTNQIPLPYWTWIIADRGLISPCNGTLSITSCYIPPLSWVFAQIEWRNPEATDI